MKTIRKFIQRRKERRFFRKACKKCRQEALNNRRNHLKRIQESSNEDN